MTDIEKALQAALDVNPGDQTARMLLAEHLWDIGDPRAAGYETLALANRWPWRGTEHWFFSTDTYASLDVCGREDHSQLPDRWFDEICRCGSGNVFQVDRRPCEDAAALAFAAPTFRPAPVTA